MAEPSTEVDPELLAEQTYLNFAHASLTAMHKRAKALLDDLRDAGHPDLDYQAALMHRIAVLAESTRPSCLDGLMKRRDLRGISVVAMSRIKKAIRSSSTGGLP